MIITQIACFEHINPFNMIVRYIELEKPSEIKFASRIPDEYEIYINISGDVSFIVEGNIYPVKPGDVIITNPGEAHHCVHHSDTPHKYYWMLFSEISNRELLKVFLDRKNGQDNYITPTKEISDRIISLFGEMGNNPGSTVQKYMNFLKMLDLLEKARAKTYDKCTADDIFTRATEYMNEHYSEKISVKQIAHESHVSVNTLERHFLTCAGTTPAKYLKKIRLAEASKLLSLGYSVQQVCDLSGFSDCSRFILQFKEMYGITPLKYTKKISLGRYK